MTLKSRITVFREEPGISGRVSDFLKVSREPAEAAGLWAGGARGAKRDGRLFRAVGTAKRVKSISAQEPPYNGAGITGDKEAGLPLGKQPCLWDPCFQVL